MPTNLVFTSDDIKKWPKFEFKNLNPPYGRNVDSEFEFTCHYDTLITPTLEIRIKALSDDLQTLFQKGEVIKDFSVQYRKTVWVFPKERFVIYEPSDERWCRFFGIGHEKEVVERVSFPSVYVLDKLADGTIVLSTEESPSYSLAGFEACV